MCNIRKDFQLNFVCFIHMHISKKNLILITGLKQLVKMKNDENSILQSKVDSLLVENKVLIDTNLNLVKGFDILEKDFKMKLGKLAVLSIYV